MGLTAKMIGFFFQYDSQHTNQNKKTRKKYILEIRNIKNKISGINKRVTRKQIQIVKHICGNWKHTSLKIQMTSANGNSKAKHTRNDNSWAAKETK